MKVLLVNTYDRGGAANACIRLHLGLLNEGINSQILLGNKSKNIPNTNLFEPKKIRYNLLQRLLNRGIMFQKETASKKSNQDLFIESRDSNLELFSYPNSNFDITESDFYKEADIVNLHWVADFLDYKSFFSKNRKPVIWTLHDMNPFSGGEHYVEQYLGIDENGYPKKRVITQKEKKEFKKNIEIKRQALVGVENLNIVTLCEWMYLEIKKSELFKNYPTHLIPNGIDSTIFKDIGKEEARHLLGLPNNKTIILFVADSIGNNRKGYAYLKKAFKNIKNNNIVLCAIGHIKEETKIENNIIELGIISDENMMCNIYNAADVYIIPSLMDNLPNTVLEALFCGTPVIGFPVGGILDMIIDGENGFISNEISVQALEEVIDKFIKNQDLFNKHRIREKAIKKYDLSIQVKAYKKLYNSI